MRLPGTGWGGREVILGGLPRVLEGEGLRAPGGAVGAVSGAAGQAPPSWARTSRESATSRCARAAGICFPAWAYTSLKKSAGARQAPGVSLAVRAPRAARTSASGPRPGSTPCAAARSAGSRCLAAGVGVAVGVRVGVRVGVAEAVAVAVAVRVSVAGPRYGS
jgi:hypothetical protein